MPNWGDVLNEITTRRDSANKDAAGAVDITRRGYLQALHKHTGRNVIAYYSGWLSKPGIANSDINDEDKNGFMMAVHRLDRSMGLDLILHTPGGNISATQSNVDYLHKMFGHDIRAIVPQIAMSAGTVMACSCHTILMCSHSNLGPIDPQIRGVPAYGVIQEFRRAYREVKKDPAKLAVWQPIISKYQPTFLSQCENAIKRSNSFVEEQLTEIMFSRQRGAKAKAKRIVKKLTDYAGNKGHDRHIHIDECIKMGLNVVRVEDDDKLQDLVLTVHHCFMHTLMNTPAFKIIENHLGSALVKRQVEQVIQVPS